MFKNYPTAKRYSNGVFSKEEQLNDISRGELYNIRANCNCLKQEIKMFITSSLRKDEKYEDILRNLLEELSQ